MKSGVVSQAEVDELNEQEALKLIFRSGISTSPIITDISGRGLGLAIVQEKVASLAAPSPFNRNTAPEQPFTFGCR